MNKPLLLLLACCTFLMALMELVVIGFLDRIATDFAVSAGMAGLMLTVHAGVVAVSAPFSGVAVRHLGWRGTLVGGLALFALGNVIVPLAPSFEVALVGRLLTGLAHGLFFPVAFAVATQTTDEDKQGSAIGLVMAGVAVATVVGAPLGTLVGRSYDWSLLFFGAAALSVLVLGGMRRAAPSGGCEAATGSPLPALRNSGILRDNAVLTVMYVGLFVAFGFITDIVASGGTVSDGQLAIMFFVFGICTMLGNLLGGKLADISPEKVVRLGLLVLAAGLAVLWLAAGQTFGIYAAVGGMGLGFAAFSPALNLLLTRHDSSLATQALGLGISATNLGIAVGAALGSAALNYVAAPQLGLLGAGLVAAALASRFAARKA